MGQQRAAATATAHPNTGAAQQLAVLALPSAIVPEAACACPRARLWLLKMQEHRACSPGEPTAEKQGMGLSLPGVLPSKVITLVSHPPAHQQDSPLPPRPNLSAKKRTHCPTVHNTHQTPRPFLLGSALSRPASRVTVSREPSREPFWLHSPHLYHGDRGDTGEHPAQHALNTFENGGKEGSKEGRGEWTDRRTDGRTPVWGGPRSSLPHSGALSPRHR